VPADQYKTQVLLLHSEQSTLDSLSAGFSDSYTVHCATSGSEALNTLVDTPINVIVTAQDLPGMSGLDALREAKKRSPKTIGILLAGNSGADIQALVGEEEVFQVVTGSVTSDGLNQLVDNATRQMRLLALAGAANDTLANVDEPAEHIIMETSENGSTIISDGTNRLPALDPTKVSAAMSVGSRSVDVLVLTKDQEFLETIKDSSRGAHKVFYANTLAQANNAISKHKIGVAVVDAAMVGEKVEQLTQHLRKGSQRLVSIVAGRRDDGEMLMDLINRGKVYRFLLKPVSPGRARLAVEASVKHHLEAPDAAFKIGAASAAPTRAAPSRPAPVERPATPPTPIVKAVPKASVVATPQAVAKQAKVKKTAAAAKPMSKPLATMPNDPPLGSAVTPGGGSPIEDGLADAFGQDDSSFTETVTGLISSFTDKFTPGSKSSDDLDAPLSIKETVAVSPRKSAPEESASAGGMGGTLSKSPKLIGMGAAAAAVLVAGLFWLFSGSDNPLPTNEIELADTSVATNGAVAPVEVEVAAEVEVEVDIEALLVEARQARNSGQVFDPDGSNAIELFATALAAAPQNDLVAAELDAAVNVALSMAESGILESRLDETDAALQRVASVDPQNSRLPFLTAQLSQLQYRANIDTARAALSENRLEEAGNALTAARAAGSLDTTELDTLQQQVDTLRSEQGVDRLLARGQARLDSGDLLAPVNDNARYYYQLVLAKDPSSTVALRGIGVIASTLVFEARSEIQSGDFNGADDILAHVRVVDPNNVDAALASEEVAAARTATRENSAARRGEQEQAALLASQTAETDRQAKAARQAEADRQAETNRQTAANREAEASRQAEIERQADADRQTAAERQAQVDQQAATERQAQADQQAAAERQAQADQQAAAERQAQADQQAAAERQAQADQQAAAERQVAAEQAATIAAAALAAEQAAADLAAQTAARTGAPSVQTFADTSADSSQIAGEVIPAAKPQATETVPVSSLNRVKYVAPKYPRQAQRRNLSGWVDVVFTVTTDGNVSNVAVRDSNPADIFNNAAVKAVEKWQFESVLESGVAVEKRAGIRMLFALE
jgi:TonB family protein